MLEVKCLYWQSDIVVNSCLKRVNEVISARSWALDATYGEISNPDRESIYSAICAWARAVTQLEVHVTTRVGLDSRTVGTSRSQ